ncbi:hypothetical protein C8F04DRAFT_1188780 [Mycena alexandri]|uniref:Uncharacterized protein n=1 Tax=Mycena alexandri TaxID=1745969 RepID=A0AAD6WUX8_9AGAR|nr:hypothetical protein C8F04DRAFT_1188780 [Mycena alexandri]
MARDDKSHGCAGPSEYSEMHTIVGSISTPIFSIVVERMNNVLPFLAAAAANIDLRTLPNLYLNDGFGRRQLQAAAGRKRSGGKTIGRSWGTELGQKLGQKSGSQVVVCCTIPPSTPILCPNLSQSWGRVEARVGVKKPAVKPPNASEHSSDHEHLASHQSVNSACPTAQKGGEENRKEKVGPAMCQRQP